MIRTEDEVQVEAALRSVRSRGEGPVLEEIERAARAPHRAAARLAASGDETAAATLAREVLLRSRSCAVAPLTEVTVDAKQRLFALRTVAQGSLELLQRVSSWAQSSLADREDIPKEIDDLSEEDPPDERVCDVAYLMLRRLHNVSEDPTRRSEEMRSFYALGYAQRDRVLAAGSRAEVGGSAQRLPARYRAYRLDPKEGE